MQTDLQTIPARRYVGWLLRALGVVLIFITVRSLITTGAHTDLVIPVLGIAAIALFISRKFN
jgi:hypothetical protein